MWEQEANVSMFVNESMCQIPAVDPGIYVHASATITPPPVNKL